MRRDKGLNKDNRSRSRYNTKKVQFIRRKISIIEIH